MVELWHRGRSARAILAVVMPLMFLMGCVERGEGCIIEDRRCGGFGSNAGEGLTRGPAGPQAAALPAESVMRAHIYLDLSVSMRGFISDNTSGMPFSLLQKAMDGIVEEGLAHVRLDVVERSGFGTKIRPKLDPLQNYATQLVGGRSPRERFGEPNTDLVGVMREVATRARELSIVITDGVQDQRQLRDGGVVGPGFIRTALERVLTERLIEGGFGVWLIGMQSDFDPGECYFNVRPDQQGQVNRCVRVSRRPVYLWVTVQDIELGRQFVTYIVEKLREEAATESGLAEAQDVEVLEIWPGNVPGLVVEELEAERIKDHAALEGNILKRRRLVSGEHAAVLCLELERKPRGAVMAVLELRLVGEPAKTAGPALGFPYSAWTMEAVAPEGWTIENGVRIGVEDTEVSRVVFLSSEYSAAVGATVSAAEIPLRLGLDLNKGLSDHWIRRWSVSDDTTAELVTGRTIYLEDVLRGTLQEAFRRARPEKCLRVRVGLE